VPLAQAATFDSAAVAGAARVAAAEAASQGVHWTFAPMVDVARDPRWGRVVEGAGEDPVLGSVMAAAQVAGFQGAPALLAGAAAPPPDVLLATPKHFAGYGFAEGGRDYNTVELTERTLWDVVLPPVRGAVRAGAATLMAAFNEIGGTPAHASRFLLQDVLRDRWRFGGLVVSDWTGVAELIPHGLGDSATVAARAPRGRRRRRDVERALPHHVGARCAPGASRRPPSTRRSCACSAPSRRSGLFDDPYRYSDTARARARCCAPSTGRRRAPSPARRSCCSRTARRPGAPPALPLRRDLRSVAVIGPARRRRQVGAGQLVGRRAPEDAVTPLAGLRRALPERARHVRRGAPADTADTSGFAQAVAAARAADAVVLVLGERQDMSAEASSRASVELPGVQLALAPGGGARGRARPTRAGRWSRCS
jgi:beta-glucosidase